MTKSNLYINVYCGYIDILGFKNFEKFIESHDKTSREHFIDSIYSRLDGLINSVDKNSEVVWTRYGDGFVFHTVDDEIKDLSEVVKKCSRFIALALSASIPLRIAITQGDLNVSDPSRGLSISGSGWDRILELEGLMNWMGGILYLPNFDGNHYPTIQELVRSTDLVKKQDYTQEVNFKPPFKKDILQKDKYWFLNWYKVLRQSKPDLDTSIERWWTQLHPHYQCDDEDVVKKQKNSIEYADYCRALLKASELIYFSEIDRNIEISKIQGSG